MGGGGGGVDKGKAHILIAETSGYVGMVAERSSCDGMSGLKRTEAICTGNLLLYDWVGLLASLF